MTKYHIEVELTVEVDDTTPDTITYLSDKFMAATGFAWVNPELGSNEPYKAFKREGEENVLVGTFLVRPIDRWFKTDGQKLQDVSNVIQKISSERRWYLDSRHLPDQITALVTYAGKEGDNAVKDMKSMLDNVIAHLRAMEIVAESVSDAGTHKEKDARLRGMIDVIGRAIQRATEFSYDFGHRHWPTYRDLFKSDFPTRELMQELHNKDAEIKRLQIKAGEAEPEVAVKVEDDNIF